MSTTSPRTFSLKNGDVAFSPDSKRVAATSEGVRVWEVRTGQEVLAIKGDGSCVAFSPDGKLLASSGGDGVKVWDIEPAP